MNVILNKAVLPLFIIVLFPACLFGNDIGKDSFYIKGMISHEAAYRISGSDDFTKILTTAQCGLKYEFNDFIKLSLSMRARYDAVFDLTDNYPEAVKGEYEKELKAREALLDLKMDAAIIRIGLQHIVWGEAPGILVADVVNPIDMSESTLLPFDEIRIPVWALDVTCFLGESTFEFIWLPVSEQNKLPVRNSEFSTWNYSSTAGKIIEKAQEDYSKSIENSGIGFRISTLTHGWDLSVFCLSAFDNSLAYSRKVAIDPANYSPVITLTPISKRIINIGFTASKSWDEYVFKSEFVFKKGRYFSTNASADEDGVTKGDELIFMMGIDKSFMDIDFNAGILDFQVIDSDIGEDNLNNDQTDMFYFFRLTKNFKIYGYDFTFKPFFINEIGDSDYRLSLNLDWFVSDNFEISLVADFLGGDANTLYGKYNYNDRILFSMKYYF